MKLTSIRVRHFKAVEDSGPLKLGPVTAFVGYNGTGKSSIIEACEFFRNCALTERFRAGRDVVLPGWVMSGGTLRMLALPGFQPKTVALSRKTGCWSILPTGQDVLSFPETKSSWRHYKEQAMNDL